MKMISAGRAYLACRSLLEACYPQKPVSAPAEKAA
jgi:hypothetical protein